MTRGRARARRIHTRIPHTESLARRRVAPPRWNRRVTTGRCVPPRRRARHVAPRRRPSGHRPCHHSYTAFNDGPIRGFRPTVPTKTRRGERPSRDHRWDGNGVFHRSWPV